jgi:hypothetical protein
LGSWYEAWGDAHRCATTGFLHLQLAAGGHSAMRGKPAEKQA